MRNPNRGSPLNNSIDKSKASDKLYFLKKTKLPFTHFFSSSSKVETQVTQLKQVNQKQHSTTKQTLTKILIKKNPLTKITTHTNFRCY